MASRRSSKAFALCRNQTPTPALRGVGDLGILRMKRDVYIILAPSHEVYREKTRTIRESSEKPVACVYGDSAERMRGIEADKVVTCVGFWDRDDSIELAHVAQSRLK